MSENATRLLLPLLATMREGILIVNSRLDIILYNDAATRIVRLPVKESQSGGGAGRADDSSYGLLVALPPAAKQGERNVVQQPRLIDATRDPAINDAFRQVLEQRTAVEVRVELIGRGETPNLEDMIRQVIEQYQYQFLGRLTELEQVLVADQYQRQRDIAAQLVALIV